jgi:hypothetical protein
MTETIGDLKSEIIDLRVEVDRLRAKKNEYKERLVENNKLILEILREQNKNLTDAFELLAVKLANK